MRYVSINSVPNGSTGAVMHQLTDERRDIGDECWMIWGRGRLAGNDHEFKFGTKLDFYTDVIETRLRGAAGFHSKRATKKLLEKLDEIQPDIIHLHNLHGYYINVDMLFDWLYKNKEVYIKWTLHDCWAFTGRCAYFSRVGCEQWISGCTSSKSCPRKNAYPKSISTHDILKTYYRKKECFTKIEKERLLIITPSQWLANLVMESYLSKYKIEVRHNKINTDIFRRTKSDFRARYNCIDKKIILGVANPWSERKGLDDFVKLYNLLDRQKYVIVLVGMNQRNAKRVPKGIICIPRTESQRELAEIYSSADWLFNPTREDNYPTVNLEAEACGTPVITYDVGGCKETITLEGSRVVSNIDEAVDIFRNANPSINGVTI